MKMHTWPQQQNFQATQKKLNNSCATSPTVRNCSSGKSGAIAISQRLTTRKRSSLVVLFTHYTQAKMATLKTEILIPTIATLKLLKY